MTEVERRLLALVERHLKTWECQTCGAVWLTGKSRSGALFHRCSVRRRGGYDWRPPRQRIDDERYDWARRTLGAAIEDELGPRAWLDPGEEE